MAISFSSQFSCSHSSRPPTSKIYPRHEHQEHQQVRGFYELDVNHAEKHGSTIMWKVKLLVLNGVGSKSCAACPPEPACHCRDHRPKSSASTCSLVNIIRLSSAVASSTVAVVSPFIILIHFAMIPCQPSHHHHHHPSLDSRAMVLHFLWGSRLLHS